MKILIVGSLRPPDKKGDKPDKEFVIENKASFEAACKALGEAFTREGHTIMVGVPDWAMLHENNTVATYVVEGADREQKKDGKKNTLIFYGPQEREPKDTTPKKIDSLKELKERCKNLYITDKVVGIGTSKASTIPNVAEVDAVILISGREGTESIGYAAYSMDKPVIAITSFGGAAETISKEVLYKDYNRFLKQGDIDGNHLRALDVDWNEDDKKNFQNAQNIVHATEKLVKAYSKPGKRTKWILITILLSLFVFLSGWVAVYLNAAQSTTASPSYDLCLQISFFGLLFISALLGAGLRILVSYQGNRVAQLTPLGLGIDLVISLLVAFGLALIYLIGGISFTGEVVVLQSTSTQQNQAFTTVAISMSLLGLAAGYLVPLNRLAERLENILAQQNK